MTDKQWNDLLSLIEGKEIGYQPYGFIIDSPWIPGWYGISNIQYYASDRHWLDANIKVCELFPDVWFFPGFWSEYGMCTEPSAFGAKMIWLEQSLPHAEKVIKNIEDIVNLSVPNVTTDGLLPFMINRLKENEGEIINKGHKIRFAVSRGPLNIASFLLGTTELMLSLAMNPLEAKNLIDKITEFICNWLRYQKECFPAIDGIFVLDDLMGFIGEDEFGEYAIPSFRKIFSAFNSKVRFLHNDANSLITAKHLAEMNVNMFNFSFEHPMGRIRELAGPEVVLVGNIPPRDIMAAGTPEQVTAAVKKAAAEIDDYHRIVWSTGGGMPTGVNNKNIYTFVEAVKKFIK